MKGIGWMKRIYALFMATFMILSLLPTSNLTVQAQEDQTVETTEEGQAEDSVAADEEPDQEPYQIRYVANGGEGEMDFQEFSSDSKKVTLDKNAFTRDGYEFSGWSTTADNEDVIVQGEIDMKAFFIPDETNLDEFKYEYDVNEDGEIKEDEKFGLTDCVRDKTLVLYAQWEEVQEEMPGEDNENNVEEPVSGRFTAPESVDITSNDLKSLTEAPEISRQEMMELRNNVPIILADENESEENPSEGDGTKIESIRVSWIDGNGEVEKVVDLTGKNNAEFSVRMRVDLTLSGQNNYDRGSVQIRIPKQIARTRDGKLSGTMSLSVPEDPDDRATFAYTDMGDYYILTNTRALPASTAVYFEFTISKMVPNTIVSGQSSDPFNASVSVETPNGQTLTKGSDDITFKILTKEQLNNVIKRDAGVYLDWPASWNTAGVPKPDNPEEYVYVDWYTYVNIYGNQNFRLEFKDDPSKMIAEDGSEKDIEDYQILGYQYNNVFNEYDAEKGAVLTENSWQGDGDRFFTHVYVAYNKKNFPIPDPWNTRVVYHVKNTIDYTLQGVDENAPEYTKNTSDTADIAFVPFYIPRGQFNVWKSGNGGDRSENYWTPDSYLSTLNYYGYALNELLDKGSTDVSYRIRMEGFGYKLTYGEKDEEGKVLDPEDPASYGKKEYSFEVTDEDLYWDDSTNIRNYKVDPEKKLDSEHYAFKSLQIETPTVYDYMKFTSSQAGYRFDDNGNIVSGTVTAGDYGFMPSSEGRPDLHIYGKINKNDEWKEMAVYSFSGNTEAKDNCSIVNDTITFTQPVAAYKVVVSTKKAGMICSVRPTVTVKRTKYIEDYVRDKLQKTDNTSIPLSNMVSTVIKDGDGKIVLSNKGQDDPDADFNTVLTDKKGTDILQGVNLGVRATKDLVSRYNDTSNYEVRLSYRLNVYLQSNLSNINTYNLAQENNYLTKETEGTFYDLLPAHVTPDLNSLTLRSGDQITSVETIPNYRNSGRTMMIVKAKLIPQPSYRAAYQSVTGLPGYCDTLQLTYDAYITWVDLVDYGKHLENNFVYESGNEQLGTLNGFRGEPDDPRGGNNNTSVANAGSAIDYLKNVNKEDEDHPGYVYGRSALNLEVDVSGLSSLTKYVSVNGDGRYVLGQSKTYNTKAYIGGLYTYRLRMENGDDTISKDLKFFDKLESFEPNETVGNAFVDELKKYGSWKGTFLNVDTSEAEKLGIDPKVYYSSNTNLDLNDEKNRKLENTEIWQLLTDQTNKEDVKILAFDLSKKTNGEEFQLEDKKSVNVYINMIAPSEERVGTEHIATLRNEGLGDQQIDGAHAYNSVQIDAKIKAIKEGTELPDGTTVPEGNFQPAFLNYEFTRVALVPLDIEVRKEWDDGNNQDGYRPKAVKVQLLADNKPMGDGKYIATLSTDKNWYAVFENVPPVDAAGKPYYFSFRELPADDATKEEIENLNQYSLTWSSKVGYRTITDDSDEGGTATYTVETKDYTLTNYHKPETVSISGTKIWDDNYDAAGKRPDSVEVSLYADGEKLTSVKTTSANGWNYTFPNLAKRNNGKEISYGIHEDIYYPGYHSIVNGTDITNTFDPYGDFSIRKTVKDGTSEALKKEFPFTIRFYDGDDVLSGSFSAEKKNSEGNVLENLTISSGQEITLKDGEILIIHEIPSETSYIVEEEEVPGFTLTRESNAEGSIRAGDTTEAEFENTYRATGSINLQAVKSVKNHDIVNHLFRFRVLDEDMQIDDVDLTEDEIAQKKVIRTTSNDAEGKVQFGAIRFSLEDLNNEEDSSKGVRTFTLQEIKGEAAGYTYSDEVYTATVKLQDDGAGNIIPTITYRKNGSEETSETPPVFTNTYAADGSIEIKAWKKITGRELKEDEFTFDLLKFEKAEDGTLTPIKKGESDVLATVKNQKDGTILFTPTIAEDGKKDTESPLYFDENDVGKTYVFKVREREGDDETVLYNTNALVYEVTVYDDNNGTLSFDMTFKGVEKTTIEEDGTEITKVDSSVTLPVIENDLKDGSLKITKSITNGDPNAEFKFKIRFEYPEGKEMGENVDVTREPVVGMNFTVNVHVKDGGPLAGVTYDLFWIPDEGQEVKVGTYTTDDSGYGGVIGLDGSQYQNGHFEARLTDWNQNYYTDEETTHRFEEPSATGDTKEYTWNLEMEEVDTAYAVLDTNSKTLIFRRASKAYVESLKTAPLSGQKIYTEFEEKTFANAAATPWYVDRTNVLHIRCEGEIRPVNLDYWFAELRNVQDIDLSLFNTSSVTSMNYTFWYCFARTINFGPNWSTSNVKSMDSLFRFAQYVEELDVEDWDTSNVVNMKHIFDMTQRVKKLDLHKWDTSTVTGMSLLVRNCQYLVDLDVSGWDTRKVETFYWAFSECYQLEHIDIRSWTASDSTNIEKLFENASHIKAISFGDRFRLTNDVGLRNPSGYGYTGKWTKLENLGISLTTQQLTSLSGGELAGTWVWERVDGNYSEYDSIERWDADQLAIRKQAARNVSLDTVEANQATAKSSEVTALNDTEKKPFTVTQSLSGNPIAEFNKETGELIYYRIEETTKPEDTETYAYFRNVETDNSVRATYQNQVKSIRFESPIRLLANDSDYWFSYPNLVSFDGHNLDISRPSRLAYLFYGCAQIESFDLSMVKMSGSHETVGQMFRFCTKLKNIDLTGWDTSGTMHFDYMFNGCPALEEVNMSTLSSKSMNLQKWGTRDFFVGSNNVKRVTIGTDFSFNNFTGGGNLAERGKLPDPPKTELYTGMWCLEDDPQRAMTANQMSDTTESIAGTWVWQPADTAFAVTFDGNGGVGSMATKYCAINEPLQLDACSFILPGYVFDGWKDSTGKIYRNVIPADTQSAGSVLNLIAQWKPVGFLTGGDGEYEIILNGDQTALIEGIPAGTKYTIYEETPDGWKLLSSSGTTGEIESLKTAEAQFRNQYEPGSASAIITAQKVLSGGTLEAGQFEFGLYAVNNGTETLVSRARNSATGEIIFPQLFYEGGEKAPASGTYQYVIREIPGDSGDITYDETSYPVSVVLVDHGNGTRSATVSTPVHTFMNTVKNPVPTVSTLTVEKLVDGTYAGQNIPAFTVRVTVNGDVHDLTLDSSNRFTASLENLPVGAIYTVEEINIPTDWSQISVLNGSGTIGADTVSNIVTVSNQYVGKKPETSVLLEAQKVLENGTLENGQFSFQLLDGETVLQTATNTSDGKILFDPLTFTTEGTWTYTVKEVEGSDRNVEYNTTEKTVTITTTLTDGVLGAETSWSENNTFTNKMSDSTLTVEKKVVDGTPKTSEIPFNFQLALNPMPESGTILYKIGEESLEASLTEDGVYAFTLKDGESAQFTLPNVTKYVVTEAEATGFVTTMEGNEGTIVSGTDSTVVITNTYSARGEFSPVAKKTMLGRPLNEGEFEFILQDENRQELQTASNKEDGSIEFSPIEYKHSELGETGTKTFTYYMMEKTSEDPDVIDDQNIVTIEVTVTDNGDGKLSVSPKYYVGETEISEIVFTNRAEVQLPAAGLTGNALPYGIGVAALAASAYVLYDSKKKKSKK